MQSTRLDLTINISLNIYNSTVSNDFTRVIRRLLKCHLCFSLDLMREIKILLNISSLGCNFVPFFDI